MTDRIRFSGPAKNDLATAKDWYVDLGVPGLDGRFQADLDELLERVTTYPEGFPLVHGEVRRATLKHFPYSVFYHRRDDLIYVLGVVHHARHPRVWRQRR